MIKPFTIDSIRVDQNGNSTVFYTVSKTICIDPQTTDTQTLKTMLLVPKDEDIDTYVFNTLVKLGWI